MIQWQCEGCGDRRTDGPAGIDRYPGYRATVELWFCEGCT